MKTFEWYREPVMRRMLELFDRRIVLDWDRGMATYAVVEGPRVIFVYSTDGFHDFAHARAKLLQCVMGLEEK